MTTGTGVYRWDADSEPEAVSVIRSYGTEELKRKIRYHISIASRLSEMIAGEKDFEILAPVILNVVCFRFRLRPAGRSA